MQKIKIKIKAQDKEDQRRKIIGVNDVTPPPSPNQNVL
jgi:hypothetical protein